MPLVSSDERHGYIFEPPLLFLRASLNWGIFAILSTSVLVHNSGFGAPAPLRHLINSLIRFNRSVATMYNADYS